MNSQISEFNQDALYLYEAVRQGVTVEETLGDICIPERRPREVIATLRRDTVEVRGRAHEVYLMRGLTGEHHISSLPHITDAARLWAHWRGFCENCQAAYRAERRARTPARPLAYDELGY